MNRANILVAALAAAPTLSAAHARSYHIGPDSCARAADAARYETPADVVADEPTRQRNELAGVAVFYAAPVRGWASRRLAARFLLLVTVDDQAAPASGERSCARR